MLKILIKDVAYKVLTVEVVDPVVLVNHVNQHESTPASYYFSRSEVKMNIIIKSSTPFHWDQIFPQAISSKIVIYFANQKAVNPFNFQHFRFTDLALYVIGNSVPWHPLKIALVTVEIMRLPLLDYLMIAENVSL